MASEPLPGLELPPWRIHKGNVELGNVEIVPMAPVKRIKINGIISFDPRTGVCSLLPVERSARAC